MEKISYRFISSLEKCFYDSDITSFAETSRGSALLGERFAFQFVWNCVCEDFINRHITLEIKSEIKDYIKPCLAESVAVRFPCYGKNHPEGEYLKTEPGLYPDLLTPIPPQRALYIKNNYAQAIWFDVDIPENAVGGSFPVEISFRDYGSKEILLSAVYVLKIIPKVLPPQTLIHTEWFYCDCLANYYNVKVWSAEHWQIIKNYLDTAVKLGINMILTPIFTPSLDTAVNWERTTNQLVKITKKGDKWSFDFSLLSKWIDLCLGSGIKYFEICHLFSQWGAKHAPKIMADVDGEYKRIFGWETDSTSEEYKSFLDIFLLRLTAFLKRKGTAEKSVFHISDEPSASHIEHYKACRQIVEKRLEGFTIIDAVSDISFYKNGICLHPIPATNAIEPFLKENIPNLWTYYCCGQCEKVSNRFISMPGARTRIIGIQLYKYNIKGFLHWGFNSYNSELGLTHINPFHTCDGDLMVPAGDPFAVYPGADGKPLDSIHYMLFYFGLQDMRALQLAEKLYGRDKVMDVIEGELEEKITFSVYPRSSSYLLSLREKINEMIEKT